MRHLASIHATAVRAAVAITGAGALALAGATTPANAAVLSATLRCESGHAKFVCDVFPSGGTGPYSATWVAVQNAGFSNIRNLTVQGFCNLGKNFVVEATVRDSAGHSLTKRGGTLCRSIPL